MRILPVLIALLVLSLNCDARMYQWLDPDSGNVQLAGKPPAWYRSDRNGPRVFVFENGELVDDTAIDVSEAHRLQLRSDAFGHTGGATLGK